MTEIVDVEYSFRHNNIAVFYSKWSALIKRPYSDSHDFHDKL